MLYECQKQLDILKCIVKIGCLCSVFVDVLLCFQELYCLFEQLQGCWIPHKAHAGQVSFDLALQACQQLGLTFPIFILYGARVQFYCPGKRVLW